MIGINLFSVVDLVAVIISTHVVLVFFYRSLRVTRRRIDLLFTGVTLLIGLESLFVLASDNVVPAGVAAATIPDAAARTLLWYRLMYITATLLMAMLTHFALRYAQSTHLRGWRVAWLYAGTLALVPLYFTDAFLSARASPLQPTSSWLCAVPWQPDAGPWSAVFLVLWLAVNIYVHWLLWHRPRSSGPGTTEDQRNFVWGGIALWGLAGLVTILLGVSGYAGVDPSMLLSTAAMVVLAIGLAEDHLRSEKRTAFVKQVFGRYVTDDVAEKVLEGPDGLALGGEKRVVSVMMSDIRGFTAIAEQLRPEQVVELLNIYLGAMADVITDHHGTINEFIGDGILAIFGAPIRREDFAASAVHCALAMQLAMKEVNAQIALLGIPPLEMGIGINTGEVIVGNIGSTKRAKYGVVGGQVNLAGRIESATVGGQVLISASTAELLPGLLEIRREHVLRPKGTKSALTVFEIGAMRGPQPLRLPVPNESWDRLGAPLAIECMLVSDEKQLVGTAFEVRVVALSPTSAELETVQGLDVATNLRMRLPAHTHPGATLDLYGKVVSCGPDAGSCVVRFTSPPFAAKGVAGTGAKNTTDVLREAAVQSG